MNRIKELLTQNNITQKELSEKLKKSYNMVNCYAQNRRQPSIETLYQISELLNVSVKELLIENKDLEK